MGFQDSLLFAPNLIEEEAELWVCKIFLFLFFFFNPQKCKDSAVSISQQIMILKTRPECRKKIFQANFGSGVPLTLAARKSSFSQGLFNVSILVIFWCFLQKLASMNWNTGHLNSSLCCSAQLPVSDVHRFRLKFGPHSVFFLWTDSERTWRKGDKLKEERFRLDVRMKFFT